MINQPAKILIAIIACSVFVALVYQIPYFPIGVKVIYAVLGSLIIFSIVLFALRKLSRRTPSVIPPIITHNLKITCPQSRVHYDVSDGDTAIHVYRDSDKTNGRLDAAMQNTSGDFTRGLPNELRSRALETDTNSPIFHLNKSDNTHVADMRRSLWGGKYEVFDPSGVLLAKMKPPLGGALGELMIEDSEGKTLADCLGSADGYKLLTQDGNVVAIVTKVQSGGVIYNVEVADISIQLLLICCHVIATDNLNYWWTLQNAHAQTSRGTRGRRG